MGSADDRAVILLAPLAPARSGNGLAMRAGVLLEALAAAGPVDLVVVPIRGPAAPLDWARALARHVQVVEPVGADPDAARAHVDRQLADPWLRERLLATDPLPAVVRAVPPSLADEIVAGDTTAVVGLRVVLAPMTVALGRRLGVPVVVDADDDDVALLRATGASAEADATERLCAAWLPEGARVWAAGAPDAAAMTARYGVPVDVVPNAVRLPGPVGPPAAAASLLFVGNLTYGPNLDAARVLATEVLPRVRAARPDAELTIVGSCAPGAVDDLTSHPAVRCTGAVAAVGPAYAAATVVVVPLRHGAGTRVKVLEAAAYGRPIVASSVAVVGLDPPAAAVRVADGPDATAAAVVALLDDPVAAGAQASAARAWVRGHAVDHVGAIVRGAMRGGEVASGMLTCRVLWHGLEVRGPAAVRDALAAVLPRATHDLPAGETFRYAVEPDPDGFRVIEGRDRIATVPDVAAARDVVHARFHRRVFERSSRAGWVRVHGALVDLGRGGGGVRVLCTGPEGAGKSTLALRLLLDGLRVQGDESVVLRGREVIAVARPLHCKPGAEAAVPELDGFDPPPPVVDGIRIVDPTRLGRPWTITAAPLDHVVVLDGGAAVDGPVALRPASQTEVLPDLVDALFPVTESKPVLLRALTVALAGVPCHRLARGTPAAMVRALTGLG